MAAHKVSMASRPTIPQVTPIQHIYFFDSVEARLRGWNEIVTAAAAANANDLLAANFRRTKNHDRVVADFGLYFAIGRIDQSKSDESDFDEEYSALCHITSRVFGRTSESAGPGVFRKIAEDDNWTLEDVLSTGLFKNRTKDLVTAFDPRTQVRVINGDDGGLGSFLFDGSARTTDRGRWPAFRKEYPPSLRGNKPWTVFVEEWLDDVAANEPESDVVLHIYNPADIMTTLVYGWPDNLAKFALMARGVAVHLGQKSARLLEGGLFWDGKSVHSLAETIRVVYGDPEKWVIARRYGIASEFDRALLDLLGLQYVVVDRTTRDVSRSANSTLRTTLRVLTEDGSREIESPFPDLEGESWQTVYGLPAFLREHYDEVSALVDEYRTALSITV